MRYEWRSKLHPTIIIEVQRPLATYQLPPEAEEVRAALGEDEETAKACIEAGWERVPSRGTGLAQAPGYRAGGKGVGGGFNPGRR